MTAPDHSASVWQAGLSARPGLTGVRRRSYPKLVWTWLYRSVVVLLIGLGGLTMLVPFLWMVTTSLKTDQQVFTIPPVWIPNPVMWSNYPAAWGVANFPRYFLNSIVVSVTVTAISLLLNSMAGYAFAKYNFRGRDVIFTLTISSMMIPFQVTMIPVFILLRNLGWLNAFSGLIVPSLASAFGIFLMRQFFYTIPSDLLDSGRIDGAGEFRVFAQIVLPLCRPAFAALGIFTFMGSWNNFIWPLIVVRSDDMRTLPLAVAALAAGNYIMSWPLLMGGAVFVVVPVILVFLVLQRYFIQGIALTGIKG